MKNTINYKMTNNKTFKILLAAYLIVYQEKLIFAE
jgi:hypothetical protein